MLCKKCNTAVTNGDAVCGYCGTKTASKKNAVVTTIALLLTAGLILSVYIYFIRTNRDAPEHYAEVEEPPSETAATEPPPARTPSPGDDAIPNFTPDYNKSMEEIRLLVDGVARAAQEFYVQFSPFSVYVTKYGYFFEYSSGQYIKTEDLVGEPPYDLTSLDPAYAGESVLILYIKPSDLSGFGHLDVESSEVLELFAAYETKEGFVIASVNNPGGVLPREDLQAVLAKYDYAHGEPRTVVYGGDDYNKIMAALVKDAGIESDSDIRYLKQDDKYAVAIVSPKDDPTMVNQFILKKEKNDWSVAIYNYEIFDKHKAVINARLVDINLEMVPRDDLTVLRKYFKRSYIDVIGTMIMNSFVSPEDGAVVYQAGTNNFCYIIFESGRKFLGYLNNDQWVMYEVETYDEAVETMNTLQKWPPTVILRQY